MNEENKVLRVTRTISKLYDRVISFPSRKFLEDGLLADHFEPFRFVKGVIND